MGLINIEQVTLDTDWSSHTMKSVQKIKCGSYYFICLHFHKLGANVLIYPECRASEKEKASKIPTVKKMAFF